MDFHRTGTKTMIFPAKKRIPDQRNFSLPGLVWCIIALCLVQVTMLSPANADTTGSPTLETVKEARQVLSGIVQETPLIPVTEPVDGNHVWLKLENLQKTGSFKLRGAYYMISKLSPSERQRGIATCSAGNHAQGVAYAARHFGIKATIFLPDNAPKEKIAATRSYGVDVVLVNGSFDDAKAKSLEFVKKTNAVYIPPFDDNAIIAGQGTIALEILKQLPEVDVIVVPVGGGGLISGIALTAKSLKPAIKVYGVQIASMPSMAQSIKSGHIVTLPGAPTIADGVKVQTPGKITFDLSRKYVDGIVTVDEKQIKKAVMTLLDKQKILAEGAGALSFSAIQNHLIPVTGKNVVCIVSGGNMDNSTLQELIRDTREE